jgi:ATP synthase F1 complex assembly factor 2
MRHMFLLNSSWKARLTQQRFFHSSTPSLVSSKKSTTSRDTRLAGRLRFYKQVGVVEVSPPWEEDAASESVESPISAGVDGTNSASGVHKLSSSSDISYMLSPRTPGTTESPEIKPRWFGVTLDGRTMKTPMGQKLAVPSERLAYAIAAEWDAQTKRLQPANMPFMTLACTTLDQVAHHPQVYREQSLNFLPTDTVSETNKKVDKRTSVLSAS